VDQVRQQLAERLAISLSVNKQAETQRLGVRRNKQLRQLKRAWLG
jgi:hypothetical protein